jgi:hypothetical protein
VWSGEHLLPREHQAFDAQVIKLNGKDYFAFTTFQGARGGGAGSNESGTLIYDKTYSKVMEVTTNGTWKNISLTPDLHEFNVVDGGKSALMTSYITFPENVSYPECGNKSTMYTKTGLFSEVLLDGSNKQIFQWSASDHFDVHDSYVCPGDHLVGEGKELGDGFDFFHINSADKDEYGDYIVSARHVSTIFKVAGLNSPSGKKPGDIIWRLGGKHNDFPIMDSEVMNSPNLNFSFQHHARWNKDINGFTFWDNANNAINPPTSGSSSGKSVRLDEVGMSATLIGQYISPDCQLDSSQGSHQVLPNGNRMLGMGSHPFMYERTEDGATAFYGRFGVFPHQSYRVFRFEWSAEAPTSEMALFTYAKYCNGSSSMYASWNGATNVASWKYYTGNDENGPFTLADTKDYEDTFETIATGPFSLFAYAEAYDINGQKLGQTPVVSTFVPHLDIVSQCGSLSCNPGMNYTHPDNKALCDAPDEHAENKGPFDLNKNRGMTYQDVGDRPYSMESERAPEMK